MLLWDGSRNAMLKRARDFGPVSENRKKQITFGKGSGARLVRKAERLKPGAFDARPLDAAIKEMSAMLGDPAHNTAAARVPLSL
jgi:hypothetical protein